MTSDIWSYGELHDTIPPSPAACYPAFMLHTMCLRWFQPTQTGIVDVHHVVTGSAQVSFASTRTLHPCDPTPIAKGIAPYTSVLPDLCEVTR